MESGLENCSGVPSNSIQSFALSPKDCSGHPSDGVSSVSIGIMSSKSAADSCESLNYHGLESSDGLVADSTSEEKQSFTTACDEGDQVILLAADVGPPPPPLTELDVGDSNGGARAALLDAEFCDSIATEVNVPVITGKKGEPVTTTTTTGSISTCELDIINMKVSGCAESEMTKEEILLQMTVMRPSLSPGIDQHDAPSSFTEEQNSRDHKDMVKIDLEDREREETLMDDAVGLVKMVDEGSEVQSRAAENMETAGVVKKVCESFKMVEKVSECSAIDKDTSVSSTSTENTEESAKSMEKDPAGMEGQPVSSTTPEKDTQSAMMSKKESNMVTMATTELESSCIKAPEDTMDTGEVTMDEFGEHMDTRDSSIEVCSIGRHGKEAEEQEEVEEAVCRESEEMKRDGCGELDITAAGSGCGLLEEVEEERVSVERSGEGSRESSVESEHRGEVQRLRAMAEHQRYLRLQHLLKQSNIYSSFLLQRMEAQKLEKEQAEQRRRGRKKKGTMQENKSPSVSSERVTRSGNLKSPPMSSQHSAEKVKPSSSSKRGRKRKAAADSNSDFDISQFMDRQGKLKQMKLTGSRPRSSSSSSSSLSAAGISKTTSVLKMDDEELDERYFEGQVIPVNQPRLVTGGVMRSYQLDGMEWLKSLYENGVNGILGDEMGLGKTLQCIAFIAYLIEQGVKGPFLVAAPLSTIPNWVAEFKRFTPSIPVVLYHGTQQEREDIRRKTFANTRVGKFSKSRRSSTDKTSTNGCGQGEELLPVVVTSYDICMRDQRFLENRRWKFLVVDEGHRIKNLNCKLIRALKSYDASNRLLLTGTPLQNNLAELWSLLNFLLPNIFNDLDSFQSLFDFDMTSGNDARERIIAQEREQHVLGTLHQILTPFLLRRLKTDVEFSLPPKKEILVYAPLTSYQEKYYKSLLDRTVFQMMEAERIKSDDTEESLADKKGRSIRRRKYKSLSEDKFESVMEGKTNLDEILTEEKGKTMEQQKKRSAVDIKMTSVFVMLRKCVNHPYLLEFPLSSDGDFLVDEQLVTCCGKMRLLDKMLPALLSQGHKVLIFSQFTRMLDVIEDYLDLRGLERGRLDGSMAFADREEQMKRFKESPDCMIFLLSTRAGGLGINLTAADTVIIYDSDWNPQCDLQAQDRCHRIGQTQPVMVYRLVTANTIDQRIVERAASKRRLEKMVIHKGKFKGLSSQCDLSIDDLIDLLHSVDHDKVVNKQEDAVISDQALAALLDRTMSDAKESGASTGHEVMEQAIRNHYQDNFKVIAERDSKGNLIRSDIVEEENVATVDSLVMKQDLQAVDSGCEVASSSSVSSTSPEPMSSVDGLKSDSCSSFTSIDSNAMGPSCVVVKSLQEPSKTC